MVVAVATGMTVPVDSTVSVDGFGLPTEIGSLVGPEPQAPLPPPFQFTLHAPLQLVDEVRNTHALNLPVASGVTLGLTLNEFELFLPGQRKWGSLDPQTGNVVDEHELQNYFFRGLTALGEPAYVAITDTGLYGVVYLYGAPLSIDPVEVGGSHVVQQVTPRGHYGDSIAAPRRVSESDTVSYEYWIMPRGGMVVH